MLRTQNKGPYLLLAPMEGVGDRCFRRAMATVGGFDEAVRDFIRVPMNAHVTSLASVYDADELRPIPLAAQIMGSDPKLMADMAHELMLRGAPRVDVNCGCPSNVVTGRGAGSSLLKDPDFLFTVVKAVVEAVPIPVTVKMRSGYDDISRFRENLFAAQESGVKYITLHPRTKADGYKSRARWDLIAEAKTLLRIPLVGNGDILTVEDAVTMIRTTSCDALMIGRGSIINPFIFQEIRRHYEGKNYKSTCSDVSSFIRVFANEISTEFSTKLQINKLKQLFSLLFTKNARLLEKKQTVLRSSVTTPHELLEVAFPFLERGWD